MLSDDYVSAVLKTDVFGEFLYIPPLTQFNVTEEIVKEEEEKKEEEIILDEIIDDSSQDDVEEIIEEIIEEIVEEPPEIKNVFKWTPPKPRTPRRP